MPKYKCINEACEQVNKQLDIDTSFLAYYSNAEFFDFDIINKKFSCKHCKEHLEFIPSYFKEGQKIGKYGIMSLKEKHDVLRKRSKDLSIPYNREVKQFKEYADRGFK